MVGAGIFTLLGEAGAVAGSAVWISFLLGGFVAAYLRYLEQPVATVVDFGCGLGHWQRVVRRHFPAARYTGVELSRYLCAQYGWTRGSVVDWVADELLRRDPKAAEAHIERWFGGRKDYVKA